MLFICYPRCSTCKKARKRLDEKGVKYTFRDIAADNPNETKRFFNTSGLKYKSLGLKEKLPSMSEDEQFALLATDGLLVKRPILVGDDFVLVGFKLDEWEARLG